MTVTTSRDDGHDQQGLDDFEQHRRNDAERRTAEQQRVHREDREDTTVTPTPMSG